MQSVLDPTFFRGLREEMVGALSANFKETDLFKLFQTGDLANLDACDPEMVSQCVRAFLCARLIFSFRISISVSMSMELDLICHA